MARKARPTKRLRRVAATAFEAIRHLRETIDAMRAELPKLTKAEQETVLELLLEMYLAEYGTGDTGDFKRGMTAVVLPGGFRSSLDGLTKMLSDAVPPGIHEEIEKRE